MTIIWAITGAKFTADSARAETFKSTNGRRGVTQPGDYKVTALGTPGPFVNVAPGGATLPAGYPNAAGQSYGTLESSATQVPAAATGSGSAVTKYLIQRISDPQFGGQAPADPLNGPYDEFVWVPSLSGLAYPYVELAKLVQPANTSAITNAMLTDIRKLTRPNNTRDLRLVNIGTPVNLTSATMVNWPYAATVDVPEWANFAQIIVNVAGAQVVDGNVSGKLQVQFDNQTGFDLLYDVNGSTTSNPARTQAMMAQWSAYLNAGTPGTQKTVQIRGLRSSGPGYIRADGFTQVSVDITFEERIR